LRNMGKAILVTGGTGYIGSHIVIELLEAGYEVVVVDNGVNSNTQEVLKRIEKITGKKIKNFVQADLTDISATRDLFKQNEISSVIHLAALKAVGESVQKPLEYYSNNLNALLVLLHVMREVNVKNFVFSSSATVYGVVDDCPDSGMTEDRITSSSSPYGKTKVFGEHILNDLFRSDNTWNITMLRYFNPVGAHKSGEIGEDPKGIPNNLMPYILQVANGKREYLSVFGSDFDTKDGTGIRDYIHITDLAIGHVSAAKFMEDKHGVCETINLGTGKGETVFDVLNAAKKAIGKDIPHKVVGRRAGDVRIYLADPSKAKKLLNWTAERSLDQMCQDAWNFAKKYPDGLQSS